MRLGRDSVAIPGASVVLHLVTADTAGEIDSTRTSERGAFAFRLPTVPDPLGRGEVYFASVTHQGILYFGQAISQASQLDSTYLIQVHDTTVAPAQGFALPLRIRYLMLEPSADAWVVTDGFQVENPGQTTLVAGDGGVVWSYPLPPGATDLEIGGGDAVSPDAVQLIDGVLRISAPVQPGIRQFMVRYRLDEPRLDVPMPGTVDQVELLVREPAPPLTVVGLMAAEPVEIDPGSTYRRYGAVNIENGSVRVLPGTDSRPLPLEWVAVALGVVLVTASLYLMRQPGRGPASGVQSPIPSVELRERLLLEVAGLDDRLDQGAAGRERAGIVRRRRELVELIRRAT
jgi:hypothetical protein